MSMNVAIEPFTYQLAAEIVPLGQQSWDECSEIKQDTCAYHGQRGLAIDPDIDQFVFLAEHGSLLAMTLRAEHALHGYALVVLYRSLHLRAERCANVDTFYVQPEHRAAMPRFMTSLEDALRERGISIIGWPVSLAGNLYRILARRGYIADDVVMELKLKEAPCASLQP
jgi:hypothetical protein